MKYPLDDLVAALAIAGIAALGGALAVHSGYDDAPGGVLIGLLFVLVSVVTGLRAMRRRRQGQ